MPPPDRGAPLPEVRLPAALSEAQGQSPCPSPRFCGGRSVGHLFACALRLLRPKYLAKWNGSEAYNVSYPNFRAFADDLESLLAANPRLADLWKSLAT